MTRGIAQMISFALLSTGCQFEPGGTARPGGDEPDPIGEADGGGNGSGSVGGDPAELVLDGPGLYHYDTSTGLLTDESGNPIDHTSAEIDGAREVSTGSFLLATGAVLRVEGALPLRIVASSTIDIAGTLDAASTPEVDGAGATPGDGLAGSSGGDIALVARTQLTVSGRILVGGAGGSGGALSAIGGDGGVGGAARLEAHAIVLAMSAVINANGGGGGEGGDADDSGRAGEAAKPDGRRAHGGAGEANEGGDGGEGAGDREALGKPGKAGAGELGAAGGRGGDGGQILLVGLVEDAGARITPGE
ncbi:MAG TPA: hypothetical protein VIG06_19255 [Kofleriaceae bacterium]|jgi:hypothetical protein